MGKPLVEDCLTLDLAWLMRLGPIRTGQTGNGQVKWSRDDHTACALQFHIDLRDIGPARLIMDYTLTAACDEQRRIQQVITLTSRPQNFGGRRWWMRCPETDKRVRTLHLPTGGNHFASRSAWGLAYSVERLSRFDRPFEKLFRVQRKLGTEQGLGIALKKPKGMWRRTFARHIDELAKRDADCAEQIVALMNKF